MQILEEDPDLYAAAERLIEAADWVIWQLTGEENRSACLAGYKAQYQDGHFPGPDFFGALNPAFADVVPTRIQHPLSQLGEKAGGLSERGGGLDGPQAPAPRWPSPTSTRT